MSRNAFKLNYIPALDGLRGIAILMVMIHHAYLPIFEGGFIGVDIFFVLSGFLITSLLISEYDNLSFISLKNFYLRRILRIFPALIVLLAVFCVASFVFLDEKTANSYYIDALISISFISNWARAFAIHPPLILGHTWSLSIEEQFYIIWPITLLMLLRTISKRYHIVVIVIFMALFSWFLRMYLAFDNASSERLYNGLDTRADTLLVGCSLGLLVSSGLINENVKKYFREKSTFIHCSIAMSMISFVMFSHINSWMFYSGFFIIEIITAILILDLILNQNSIIGKILTMRWIVWIGTISYGLYLWHYPIYILMRTFGLRGLELLIISVLITFIITSCSYYFIEKPILKFKKHFSLTN